MSKPHILIIPFPAQGHLLALLDLSYHLSTFSNLTILTTPNNLPLLSPLLNVNPNNHIQTLVFPLPPHPSLPSSSSDHLSRLPSSASAAALIHSLSFLVPQIIAWARSNIPHPVTAIISDFFLGWAHHVAAELNVPRYSFHSTAALLVSVLDCLFLSSGGGEDDVAVLPDELPKFDYEHLPSVYRRYKANKGVSVEWDFVKDCMCLNIKAQGVVLNSFDALESKYLEYLKRSYGRDRVWAIGPILSALPMSLRGGQSSVPVEELTAWLDASTEKSVVYICFGSQFKLGGPHAKALVSAVEVSGVRFVWCIGNAEFDNHLFEERTKGRGLVIRGWAPQMSVLSHRSVGAFLTHCGWNSVLEGLLHGVLLLTWPMEADQFVNAKLLVEEMEVAVKACEGGPNVVPEVDNLAKILKASVDEKELVKVKRQSIEMGRLAVEAVAEGGSSWNDLNKFGKELTGCSGIEEKYV